MLSHALHTCFCTFLFIYCSSGATVPVVFQSATGGAVPMVFQAGTGAAIPVPLPFATSTTYQQDHLVQEFTVVCTANNQTCNNDFSVQITCPVCSVYQPLILVGYTPYPSQCGPVFALIAVDGISPISAGPLAYQGGPTNLPPYAMMVLPGANYYGYYAGYLIHTVTISAAGLVGGCNQGVLRSFGGKLRVKCLPCDLWNEMAPQLYNIRGQLPFAEKDKAT